MQLHVKNPRLRAAGSRNRCYAFTLVELLMVISIIAILAGMLVGLSSVAGRKMRLARVQAELAQLVTAVDAFYDKYKVYPPDNKLLNANGTRIPELNLLAYELMGTIYYPTNQSFLSVTHNETLTVTQLKTAFGVDGFVNSAEDPKEIKNFLPSFKAERVVHEQKGGVVVDLLKVPVDLAGAKTNFWRYISSNPTNNPDSYDLWAEFTVGKDTYMIGNWNAMRPIIIK